MDILGACMREARALTLSAARASQTLVIAGLDRLAQDRDHDKVRPLGRLWAVQLDLVAAVAGDPERAVDDAYASAQRLLALHREFMSRLFEVLEGDIWGATHAEPEGARVIPLHHRFSS